MEGNFGDLAKSVISSAQQGPMPYEKLHDFIQGEQRNFRGNDVKKVLLERAYGTHESESENENLMTGDLDLSYVLIFGGLRRKTWLCNRNYNA